MHDPYKILGVTKAATAEEIKKAYRKLAKAHHPDLNIAGNKAAEKKFKEISHAFDLIGTKEAKDKFDLEDTQNKNQRYASSKQAADQFQYSKNVDEIYDQGDLFTSLFGNRTRHEQNRFNQMNIKGEDELFKLDVSFTEAALGGEKTITLPNGKILSVKIPAGIESKKKLKFKGLGAPGFGNGQAGDVYIEINVESLTGFTRVNNDIHTEVAISFFEAIDGAEIQIPTLLGSVMLKIPAGSSSGTKLRVKHKGAGPTTARGNLIVTLKIVMPKEVSRELKTAISSLEKDFAYNPRRA